MTEDFLVKAFDSEIKEYVPVRCPICDINDVAYNTNRFIAMFLSRYGLDLNQAEKANLRIRAFWFFYLGL